MTSKYMYDVIILGSGPAGLTAGIYCQRFGLSTLLLAGTSWGGQLQLTTDVENWPGTRSILGPQLMKNMRDHAVDLGVEIRDELVSGLVTSKKPFVITTQKGTYESQAVIIATGEDTKWMGVPNEDKLRGRGVSSCAPCDGFFFKGKPVAVVGGGDSAMEEAQVIAKVASDVVVIHRRDEFRAQQAMIDKVTRLPNVRLLYNTQVIDVIGDTALTGLLLATQSVSPKQGCDSFDTLVNAFGGTKKDETQWVLPRAGVFVAIGHVPNTSAFPDIEKDSHGYIKRHEEKDQEGNILYATKTNMPGIFTAGDVHDTRYRQAITAGAFGCMAALDVQRWLTENG